MDDFHEYAVPRKPVLSELTDATSKSEGVSGSKAFFSLGPILGILLALILAASGTLDAVADSATQAIRSQSASAIQTPADEKAEAAAQSDDTDLTVADIAAKSNEAVVTVRATGPANESVNQQMPGSPGGRTPEAVSSGSGFLIDTDGHIVTNAHVVIGAESYDVVMLDGTVVPAELIGYDEFADVAVLQMDPDELDHLPTPLTLGDSSAVRAGDQVVAIGSPYGELTNTVSTGIVGAIDRALPSSAGFYSLSGLIQHDAPIYPGNSGGPLLNMQGEVVGINVAKLVITGGTGDGSFGFALGIDDAEPIIEQIVSGTEIARPYLGITSRALQDGTQAVVDVDRSGPSAGLLEPGDVMIEINGSEISLDEPFLNQLFTYAPGESIELTVIRGGETIQVDVTLGTRPTTTQS